MKRGALMWLGLLLVAVCVQSAERSNQNTWKDEDESEEGERIYYDAEKGLTVLVDEEEDVCWLAASTPEDLDAVFLENFRSQNQDPEDENDEGADLEVKDRSLLGPTISTLCEDKPVFWLFPKQDEESKEDKSKLSRTKRSGYGRRRYHRRRYHYRPRRYHRRRYHRRRYHRRHYRSRYHY